MLRPNFEDPLDTAEQLVEQNITLFYIPGGEIWKQQLMKSPNLFYQTLGKAMIIPQNWDEFDYLNEFSLMVEGTHAQLSDALLPYEEELGIWHRSTEKVSGKYPFGGYLSRINWHLNEVNNKIQTNYILKP